MDWDKSASLLLEKVPPFVQKVVREKIETLVREHGRNVVTEADVIAARDRFMDKIGSQQTTAKQKQSEYDGKLCILKKYPKYFDENGKPILYQVKTCRGAEVNCPFLITDSRTLAEKLKNKLEEIHFTEKLMDNIEGQILPHHTMKLSVSG